MKIVTIGHVCIDNNKTESTSYTAAGSPAMFINRIYKFFPDVEYSIISPYGPDFLPYKGTVKILPTSANEKETLVYEATITNGIRHFQAFKVPKEYNISFDSEIIKEISEADIIIIAPILSNISADFIDKLCQYLHPNTLKVLLPQGYFRKININNDVEYVRDFTEGKAIIPLIDLAVLSETDSNNTELQILEWVKLNPDLKIAMTMAEKGVKIFEKNKAEIVSVNTVPLSEIVDSSGSGDIFAACLSYKYYQTRGLLKSARYANNIARECLFYKPDDIILQPNLLTDNEN